MHHVKCANILVAKTSQVAEPKIKKQGNGVYLLRKKWWIAKGIDTGTCLIRAIPTVK